jgi:2-dehydropantoate 2-reductase
MKVAVLGAGAIGGFVGGLLALSGTDTTLIARGEHLAATRRAGLRILGDGLDVIANVPATDDPADVGLVDVVLLGLKAYSYASCGPLLAPLLGPQTIVVAAQNGIPWWYFHRQGGPFDGRRLESVDPQGAVSAAIPPERAIGCVPYPAAEIIEPGVIRHLEGMQFPLGETDRSKSDRCRQFAEAMTAAGFRSPVTNIRPQIWLKLMGNAAFNPISALTRATMAEICTYPSSRALVVRMMEEIAAVAAAAGDPPPSSITIERRLAGAERVGHHKTSMLQDLEAGKPLEVEALLGSVVEIAEMVGVEAPNLRSIHGAVALLDRTRQNRKSERA